MIVSSTPWGSDGLVALLYAQAESGELRDAVAHGASTADSNPTVDPEFLEAEEARDPEGYKSEYLALFVGGGMSYLDPETISDAVTLPGELSPEQGVGWVAGLDPAFSSDSFGLALVARDRHDRQRLVLGLARAWKPTKRKAIAFEERRAHEDAVLAEVADVCLRYGARVVTDVTPLALRGFGAVEGLPRCWPTRRCYQECSRARRSSPWMTFTRNGGTLRVTLFY